MIGESMKKSRFRVAAIALAAGLALSAVPAAAHAAGPYTEWRVCSSSTGVYTTSTPNGASSLTDHTYSAGPGGSPTNYYWKKSFSNSTATRTSYSGMSTGNATAHTPSAPPFVSFGCYKYT